jgi:NAD(P)-dependent dehydrogenase (short-subunit alcohol dehydrogenase family)
MAYGLVTVFGGTGFLGRRIVERLRTAGTRVRVAVRHTTEGAPQGGDIEVVYAVGLYVEHGEATFQAVQVDGAQEVARAAREAGIQRLVHHLSGIGADVNSQSSYVRSRASVSLPHGRRVRRLPSSARAFSSAEETLFSGPLRRSFGSHPSSPFSVTDRHGSSRCLLGMSRKRS